nr:hypothetical protein CE91St29_16030 [Corynebacterium striatum]
MPPKTMTYSNSSIGTWPGPGGMRFHSNVDASASMSDHPSDEAHLFNSLLIARKHRLMAYDFVIGMDVGKFLASDADASTSCSP